jgi:hypothetical protein
LSVMLHAPSRKRAGGTLRSPILRTSGWIGESTLVVSMSRASESVLRIALMIQSPATSSKAETEKVDAPEGQMEGQCHQPSQRLWRDRINGFELFDTHSLTALVR